MNAIISAAVQAATEQTRQTFNNTIDELTVRLRQLETPRAVEVYQPVGIEAGKTCDESLDLVKSLPEFKGEQVRYISWRQAAFAAYKLFEGFEGSSKHYQAVAIIRNKVVGSADQVLSSFNTVLNFKAIMSRLDFTYADKRPVYLIEQEMSTLRQGRLSIIEFYDEVEKKLTLIINKTIMVHQGNTSLIDSLSQKYRQDALRIFISGLRKPMCDILFSSQPTDMPGALALAQELESNQARYVFASSFSNRNERSINLPPRQYSNANNYSSFNSPHYKPSSSSHLQSKPTQMEVDPTISHYKNPSNISTPSLQNQASSQGRISNNNQARSQQLPNRNSKCFQLKRHRDSDRQTQPKFQRVNHIHQNKCRPTTSAESRAYAYDYDSEPQYDDDNDLFDYHYGNGLSENEDEQTGNDKVCCNQESFDEINFLEENLSCPM